MSQMNFLKPTNRPGLPQVSYRIADYARFRQALLDLLATQLSDDADQGGPLVKLTTRSPDDPAIALLDAWAVVGDVLTFYQERLINEGFLRTATERRSIVELARAIGYQLSPGVAAGTDLAFTVDEKAGMATVPKGTQILSIPTGDELPQTFETMAAIVARADWNALKPRPSRPQQITPDTRQIYLQGINLSLQPGDRLLLHDADPKHLQDYWLTIATVTPLPARGSTRITWSQQLPAPIMVSLREPQVFAFQQRTGLFGQVAPMWENLAPELKRNYGGTLRGGLFRSANSGASWIAGNQGFPNVDIQCSAINSSGHLFLGTANNGIWRSIDNGNRWATVNAGLINPNVQTIWINDYDQLWAGCTAGNVFRSKDNGKNWVLMSQGTIRLKPDASNPNRMESVNTGLPNTVIHVLVTHTPPLKPATITPAIPATQTTQAIPVKQTTLSTQGTKLILSDKQTLLAVGDVIIAAGQSKTITTVNTDQLTIDTSFHLDLPIGTPFSIGGTYWFVGTDEGVFRSQDEGKTWSPKGLSTQSVRDILILSNAGVSTGANASAIGIQIYAATDDGIFVSDNYGDIWVAVNNGLSDRNVHCLAAYQQFCKGTISSRDVIVTGVGTAFRSELSLGDPIIAADQVRVVIAISSDHELTLDSAFNSDLPANTPFSIRRNNNIFAGTADGVFRSTDRGTTWIRLAQTELIDRNITCLTAYFQPGEGTISIANTQVTGKGTAFTRELKVGDQIIVAGQTTTIVSITSDVSLIIDPDINNRANQPYQRPLLIAGTSQGLWRSGNPVQTWSAINTGLTSLAITALSIVLKPGVGTITSTNTTITGNNTRFTTAFKANDTITVGAQTRTVTAIASDISLTIDQPFSDDLLPNSVFINHNLFTGTKFNGFVEDEWTRFQINPTAIDLDTLYNKILVDSWLVLLDENPLGVQFQAVQVASIANVARQDFSLDLKVSRVLPAMPVPYPDRFRLRNTVVFAQSQTIALAAELLTIEAQQHQIFTDPIQQQQIWLSQFVTGLQREQSLIVSGKRMRATVNVGGFLRSVNWSPTAFTDPVLAMAIADNGNRFVGNANGAFASSDGGQTWNPIANLQDFAVTAFVFESKSNLGTLTSQATTVGLRSDRLTNPLNIGDTLTATGQTRTILTVNPLPVENPQPLPLFRFTVDAPFSEDLVAGTPFTITILWAGTAKGVFQSRDQGKTWTIVGSGLTQVQALAIDSQTGAVFAGTRHQGVWLLASGSTEWTPIGLSHEQIQALLVEPQTHGNHNLWVGTQHGIWQTQNNGRQWRQFTQTKQCTGTIDSDGTQLFGRGSQFHEILQGVDLIGVGGQTRQVRSVISDSELTLLTLEAPFGPDVTSVSGYFGLRSRSALLTVQETRVSGVDTSEFAVGYGISVAGQMRMVRSISSTALEIDAPLKDDIDNQTIEFLIVRRGQGNLMVGVVGTDTLFRTQLQDGDRIIVQDPGQNQSQEQVRTIREIVNDRLLLIDAAFVGSLSTGTAFRAETGLTQVNISSLALIQNQEQHDLFAGTDGGVFVSIDRGEHWQPRSRNLTDLQVRSLAVSPDQQAIFVGTHHGGISRSTNKGELWLSLNVGLGIGPGVDSTVGLGVVFSNRQVNAIVIANADLSDTANPNPIGGTQLLAGTAGGVFSSTELGNHRQQVQWERSNHGLPHPIAHTLAIYPSEEGLILWLGGSDGVFRSRDNGDTWQPAREGLTNFEVRSLALIVLDDQPHQPQLFAGTPDGIFRSIDQGKTWQFASADLTYLDVQVLLSEGSQLWAGMQDGGVFLSLNQGQTWTPSGLTNRKICALSINPITRALFAGTANSGIWRSIDQGGFWTQLVTEKLGKGTVTSNGTIVTGTDTDFPKTLKVGSLITAADQTRMVAAVTSQTQLTVTVAFRPDLPLGTTFSSNTGLTSPHMTALIADAVAIPGSIQIDYFDHQTITITQSTIQSTDRADFFIGSQIIVVSHDSSNTSSETRIVTQITSRSVSCTELTLDRALGSLPDHPKVYANYLFAGTDGSGIFLSRDAGETWMPIANQPELLEIRCLALDQSDLLVGTARHGVWRGTAGEQSNSEQWSWSSLHLGLTNTEIRAVVSHHPTNILVAGVGILLSPDRFYATAVKPDDHLWITAPPDGMKWSVVDRDQFAGIVMAQPDDIILYPAGSEDPIVSETVSIADPPTDQALPILTLNAPLQNSYDPATVSIYGNVVTATHGATVQAALGSGDGTVIHQRFELKKPPLTYTAAPTASGADSTLQVFVNDVRWQEARSLFPLTPVDSSYFVQIADDGTTTVTFGDGKKGSRLPSGLDNVTAIYRSGIGLAGNVPASSLALLKTRPLGIVEVTNPIPASGGADREDLATARSQAPTNVRTLDRIVSRQDFEDFARTFAGIGKAQAVVLWAGETQLVHLSVVASNGDAIDRDATLYSRLTAAMNLARDPNQRVQIDSAAAQQFNVEAKVLIDARYQSEKVLPVIRDRLLTTFAFAVRQFGQGVTAAEAIAVIQCIPGVVAVDLDALYRLGTPKNLLDVLPAEVARWDDAAQIVHPARLLLINPQEIVLTSETVL